MSQEQYTKKSDSSSIDDVNRKERKKKDTCWDRFMNFCSMGCTEVDDGCYGPGGSYGLPFDPELSSNYMERYSNDFCLEQSYAYSPNDGWQEPQPLTENRHVAEQHLYNFQDYNTNDTDHARSSAPFGIPDFGSGGDTGGDCGDTSYGADCCDTSYGGGDCGDTSYGGGDCGDTSYGGGDYVADCCDTSYGDYDCGDTGDY